MKQKVGTIKTVFFGDSMTLPNTKDIQKRIKMAFEYMRRHRAVKVLSRNSYGIIVAGETVGAGPVKVILWKSVMDHFLIERKGTRECCYMPVIEVEKGDFVLMDYPESPTCCVTNFIQLRPEAFTMVYYPFKGPELLIEHKGQRFNLEKYSQGQDGLIFGTYRINHSSAGSAAKFPHLQKFGI